jgi:4'-phosphopantetheinyl transferase EntD
MGLRRDVLSLGIDVEPDEPVEKALWSRICTDAEHRFISTLDEPDRGAMVRLIFSAKECLYKCQYPVTKSYLGFHDVELEVDVEGERFAGRLGLSVGKHLSAGTKLEGRFTRTGGHIVTTMSFEAAPLPPQHG